MFVLVVNATAGAGGSGGRSSFRAFVDIVRQAFVANGISSVQLTARHCSKLTDWVYDYDVGFQDKAAVTRFDRLDFVFIYGDPALLPWMKAARQVRHQQRKKQSGQ